MKLRWIVLLLLGACSASTQNQAGVAALPPPARPLEVPPEVQALEVAFASVAERVSKSVVAVRVESRRNAGPTPDFPFGEWFGAPGGAQQREQIQRGTGSGVVIRSDGYILTNRHVVENASRVQVVFQDGRILTGKILAVDGATDLAIVKVAATGLAAAPLADSNRVQPGQWVIAIGSPFGLDYTVTVGVVSAVGRGGMGMNEIEDYLQTDASINPGNSGGPLVSLRGEVVGINTMIVGSGTGIGFAIPSSLARNVADQLIDKGSVHRAFIGVGFQELTPELAEHLGLQGRSGALVSGVMPGGPADKAGIRPGDVITSVDGQPIAQSRALLRLVLAKQIGSKLLLGVVRERQELALTLVTVERPNDAQARPSVQAPDAVGPLQGMGLHLQAMDVGLAARLGYAGLQGALVADVARSSAAERAGLARGDLIVEADRKPVRTPADVDAALVDGSALLRLRRRDAALYVVLSRSE